MGAGRRELGVLEKWSLLFPYYFIRDPLITVNAQGGRDLRQNDIQARKIRDRHWR